MPERVLTCEESRVPACYPICTVCVCMCVGVPQEEVAKCQQH